MVMLDHMDDYLTHIWRWCSGMERMYWCCKESEDLDTNVLMLPPLDDAWRHNYSVLSVVQGSSQISQKEAEHWLFLTENQIWLKFRRWLGIRGFPETQSRMYASSCTENRVCLIADNFCLESALFSTTAVLYGISDTVWYFWWCSSSHNSVSNVLMKMPWWFVGGSFQDAQTKGEP